MTVGELTYQPFEPSAIAGRVVWWIVGAVRSILNGALSVPALVLPARSEHGPELTTTVRPWFEPLVLVKSDPQPSRPDGPPSAWNWFVTGVTYQSLLPSAGAVGPRSMMVGPVTSTNTPLTPPVALCPALSEMVRSYD